MYVHVNKGMKWPTPGVSLVLLRTEVRCLSVSHYTVGLPYTELRYHYGVYSKTRPRVPILFHLRQQPQWPAGRNPGKVQGLGMGIHGLRTGKGCAHVQNAADKLKSIVVPT